MTNRKYSLAACLLCAVLVFTSILGAAADMQDNSPQGDSITWRTENGTLIIFGSGKMENFTETIGPKNNLITTAPWYEVHDCPRIVLEEGITSLGDYAFWNKTSVTSITLPESLTSIGSEAFAMNHFLKDINLPDSITYIGSSAFAACSVLTNLRLPASLERISPNTFTKCESLMEIRIPDSVVSIGDQAFNDCICLEKVILPASVTTISPYAFTGCDNLQDIIVIKGSYAEKYCINHNLPYTSVDELPEQQETADTAGTSLTWKVEDDTLIISGTGAMEDYDIPYLSPDHPKTAPWAKEQYTRIVVEEGITSIGNNAFSGQHNLTSVSLPESLLSIGKYAFANNNQLTEINLPDSVTQIGGDAFFSCGNLKSIDLPASLRILHYRAFYDCIRLERVTLPASLHMIDDSALSGCGNLKHIIVEKGSYAEQYCIANNLPFISY